MKLLFHPLNSIHLKPILIGFFVLLVSACSSNTEDLKAWVDTIKSRPPGIIKQMPEVLEYKPHNYASAELKSPFSELEPELESQLQALHDGCDESARPEPNRRKEGLERYSLDSMEMVGLIRDEKKLWGLMKMTAGPEVGKIFHVTVGSYLGINHGKIVDINQQQIEVTTLVPDNKGCWEKRIVYMALVQK